MAQTLRNAPGSGAGNSPTSQAKTKQAKGAKGQGIWTPSRRPATENEANMAGYGETPHWRPKQRRK